MVLKTSMGLVIISPPYPSSSSSSFLSTSLLTTYSSKVLPRFSRCRISSRHWFNQPSTSTRVNNLTTRCSSANIDVNINHVAIEDECQDDSSSSVSSGSLIPIVHLNHLSSDILEGESVNLLTEDTYINDLLTTLPVLSEEEQNALAAIPAHPAGLYALYASCLAGNLVEQLWNFAWPAGVAMIHPSLLPVAVVGFFTKFGIFIGGPLVGKLMDHFPRVPAYNCLSTVQAAAQLLSVAMIIRAHTVSSLPTSSVLLKPWFTVLVLAGAVERLSGLALGVAMERDWVVLLAGMNRPIALAQANAIISRIDLLCEGGWLRRKRFFNGCVGRKLCQVRWLCWLKVFKSVVTHLSKST